MVSEEIIKVLEYLGEKYGLAIDWTSKNFMPYIEDLISRIKIYNIVSSIAGILLGIIFLIVTFLLIRYGIKKNNKKDECWYWLDEGFLIICIAVATSVVGIIISILNTCSLIQNIFLPEKSIISMFSNLL